MSDSVKIQIDLKAGSVNVDAPVDAIDTVFDRLESFLPRLAEAHSEQTDVEAAEEADEETVTTTSSPGAASSAQEAVTTSTTLGTRRRRTGSSKPESFRAVNLGIDEEQRRAFKEYFEGKKPTGQNQQVLVVMVWLTQNAEIEVLSREQIFTGLRTVGARVPTRLSSVLSNLVLEGYLLREDKNFRIHHTAEDLVTHELPKPESK